MSICFARRGCRSGGGDLVADFVLWLRRRGDASSGVVAGPRSLYRSVWPAGVVPGGAVVQARCGSGAGKMVSGRRIRSGTTVSAVEFAGSGIGGAPGISPAVKLHRRRCRRSATHSNGLQSASGAKKPLLIQGFAVFVVVLFGSSGGGLMRWSGAEDSRDLVAISCSLWIFVLLCRDSCPFCILLVLACVWLRTCMFSLR